jgi:hypothetical protein
MDRSQVTRADVPDARYPSDNSWDVPTLLPALQAQYSDLPIVKWGMFKRSRCMHGCYHFYTEDYKFDALWSDPTPVARSGCTAVVEPNFSTNDDMPHAVAAYGIYRKRWLARYWQSLGVRVWVDLCVAKRFQRLNLLGVPAGWASYMTRGYADQLDVLQREYELAAEQCGDEADLRFVVYGGGRAVRAWCEEKRVLHVPEAMHVFDGRVVREADHG